MPQFGSPFGGGYGLGQIGAGVAENMLQAKIRAPQLAYEGLRNEALQTQLTNQKAQQEALATEAPTPEGQQDLTPLDKPLRDMQAQIQALRKAGQGQKVNELMPEYIRLSQEQHTGLIGMTASKLLGPNPKAAIPGLKAAGFGDVSDVSVTPGPVNPQTGVPTRIFNFTMPDGSTHQMDEVQVAQVAANPQTFAQNMALANYHMGQLDLGYRKLSSIDESRRAQNEIRARAQQFKEESFPELMQSREKVAQIGAGGRVGAAQVSADERRYRFMEDPEHKMISTLVEQGQPYEDAYAMAQAIKKGPKGKSAEDLAVSMFNHEIQVNPAKFNTEQDKQQYIKDTTRLIRNLQGQGAQPLPASPSNPKPTAPPVKPIGATFPKGFKPTDEQTRTVNNLIAKKNQADLDRYVALITKGFKEQ